MSVIIRLQNLPWSANALDIRGFFRGLSIPDGGVHIVGGEMGDAFIAFSTDEDARQAMMLDRGKINEVQIRLLLSSRAEMQKVIEQARQQSFTMMQLASKQPQTVQQSPKPIQTPQPPIITSTSLQNILSQQKSTSFIDSSTQQIVNQLLSDNSTDSRDSREKLLSTDPAKKNDRDYSKTKDRDRSGRSIHSSRSCSRSRSHSRSRSRSRGRRRSRSRDRDRSSARRRGRRSRTRSPDRRSRKRRSRDRSLDRNRDRDRSDTNKNSRERSRSRDRTRDSNDKKSGVEKEIKQDIIKPVPFMENKEKKDTVSSTTPWASIMQAPPPQNPAFTTNFNQTPGQTFNTTHLQYPPPNISLLNNIQQFTSTSFQPFQQMQFSQLQLQNQQQQQQQQSLLQQSTLSEMLQKQQKDTKPLNAFDKFKTTVTTPTTTTIQNFLNSNLGSSLANSLFNTTNVTNAFKLTDMTNSMKTIQNPFNMDQKFSQSTTSVLTSINDNTFNKNSDFTKFFNKVQDSVTDNKFNDKNERRTFQNNSVRDDPREKRSEFHQQNRTRNNYIAGNCVKITNMCPTTTYSDIRKFFSGIYIANNGIKLLNDRQGNRIGTGFIRFLREDSKPKVFLKNGTVLNNKKIVIEDITEREFDDAIDSYRPTKWNKIYDNDDTKSSTSRSRSPTKDKQKDNDTRLSDTEFSALLVEDLPPFATEQDVMKMFSLYSVIDIIFTRQTTGKKQYIAYVKFHRAEDTKQALSDKMKHTIGHKQVFVSPCSNETFDKAKELHTIRDDNNDDDDGDNEEDVKDEKNENDEDMKMDNDENENEEEDQEEINDTNKSKDDDDDEGDDGDDIQMNDNSQNSSIGKKSTRNDKNKQLDMDISNEVPKIPSLLSLNPINPADPRQRNLNKSNNLNLTRFVHLKNFDYKATKLDVFYFFSKINLIPLRIEFLKNNRGQQNGEIIVEFQTPDDANKSLQNNNALCMNRRIRIELVPSSFVQNKLGDDFVKQNNNFNNNFGNNVQQQNLFNDKNNLKRNIGNSGIRQRPSRFSDANDNNRSNSPFENNRNRFGGGNIDKGGLNTSNYQKGGSDTAGGGGNRNNFHNRSNLQQTISNSAVDSFGKPGCVVSLENVPYKAEIEDILEFFDRFNIKPHNVIRRYNDDGTPTGDARVSFPTPNDAQQAVKTRNKQKMFSRTIFLAII